MGLYLNGKVVSPALFNGSSTGVFSVNGEKGYVVITADSIGALTESDLQAATDTALKQAKESGEFDGAKGDKGDPGVTGTRGSTWSISNGGTPSMDGDALEGDMLLDKSNGDVYAVNAKTMAWEKVMNIKGPKGDKGDKGDGGTGGTAASANKLTTPRTINVSGGAEGAGVSFDGSQNVAIPINGFKEKYLSWGGRSIVGDVSPIDASMSYLHSANRAQFANPKGIIIEYSTDGGTTWVDYDASDNRKIGLVSGIGYSFFLGKRTSGTGTTSDALRITINAADCGIYTNLKTVLIELTTGGFPNLQVKVEKAMRGSETEFVSTIGTYNVTGWSGWNSLGLNIGAFGGGNSQTTNTGALRFTFTCNEPPVSNQRAAIMNMIFLGTTYWTTPSNMARTGHIYNWDSQQNVSFPAAVTATTFNGKATSASIADTATNVSGAPGAAAVARHVWFSDSDTETKRTYNDSFKYNPSGNIASVNISGNATTATKATQDSSGNDITATYATKTEVNTGLAGKLPITGGTLTGDLTGKHLAGTWLQTTEATEANSTSKVAVIDNSGWIYYRTLAHLKTDLSIPTKTSQLTNDSGFLTSHQSLSGYAKETWVTQQIQSAIDATWEASY